MFSHFPTPLLSVRPALLCADPLVDTCLLAVPPCLTPCCLLPHSCLCSLPVELCGQITQELSAEAPNVVEYLPAPQSRHVAATDAPVAVEYLPAPQSELASLYNIIVDCE
jgi:hypothetical protein